MKFHEQFEMVEEEDEEDEVIDLIQCSQILEDSMHGSFSSQSLDNIDVEPLVSSTENPFEVLVICYNFLQYTISIKITSVYLFFVGY